MRGQRVTSIKTYGCLALAGVFGGILPAVLAFAPAELPVAITRPMVTASDHAPAPPGTSLTGLTGGFASHTQAPLADNDHAP